MMGESSGAPSAAVTMETADDRMRATGILEELGLKAYEASCYVALSRVEDATAKDVSEIADVPRTRVYDAMRVLETKGLVEIQHSNPQRFRAVPLEEAVETLRDQFESRVERLSDSIGSLDPVQLDREPIAQEVWSLSGSDAIANRTTQLVGEAAEEVVLVVGDESVVTPELVNSLDGVPDAVALVVGTLSAGLADRIRDEVPRADVFVSGLEWLRGEDARAETAIGRMLLVDRRTILTSSYDPGSGDERAVFGRGFGNGLVVVVRRLMETGLLSGDGP